MSGSFHLLIYFLLSLLLATNSLENSLVVHASPKHGDVLKAGESKIIVTWGVNHNIPASTVEKYKNMKVKLCYAPVSQEDRGWRGTKDELSKEQTCQFTIADRLYRSQEETTEWLVARNIPTATYFVRVYAFDSDGHEVAYGQTTDSEKISNLFDIHGITGRNEYIDTAACFLSAVSVLGLFGFCYAERRAGRIPRKN